MTVTVTIKRVPERLIEGLRRRAVGNHRSQQQELLLMLERAIDETPAVVAEPTHKVYRTGAGKPRKSSAGKSAQSRQPPGKLGLDALWQRARKLGATMSSESSASVRADRDVHGH